MTSSIDYDKVKLLTATILWAILFSYVCQPLIHLNQNAINIIVTVYSILAGFLIAVITLVGDPSALPVGSWRIAELSKDVIEPRMLKFRDLFVAYLITLALIFVSTLMNGKYLAVQIFIEYVYLFFAGVTGIFSFFLPSALMELQKERIEQEVNQRRKEANIKN